LPHVIIMSKRELIAMTDKAILEVRGVGKSFEDLKAVDDVTFSIKPGETLGLVGESGSGKTTLGKCILKLQTNEEGVIIYGDQEIQALSESEFRPYRAEIQMLFQNPLTSFNPLFTIQTSILEYCNLNGELATEKERIARAKREIERVNLPMRTLSSKPNQLSGGQLQRAALARVLVTDPKIIVLDEPTSSLDMSTRGQIIGLLKHIQNDLEVSYLIISHDLRVIRSIAHRVMVMYLGEIVEEASNKELFSLPGHPYTRALLKAASVKGVFEGGKHKDVLQGEVTQSSGEYSACKLATRCQYAKDRCFEERQKLNFLSEEHAIRCWRVLEGDLSFEDN